MTIDFPSFLLSSSVLPYGWFDSWAEDRPWTEVLGVRKEDGLSTLVCVTEGRKVGSGTWRKRRRPGGHPTNRYKRKPFFFFCNYFYI